MAEKDGGLIPSVLAGMAVEELLSGRLSQSGIVPVHKWIRSEKLIEGLVRRGLQLWWMPSGKTDWQHFSLADLNEGSR